MRTTNLYFKGKLGKDPRLSFPKDKPVCNFDVAISRGKNFPPAWLKCVAFNGKHGDLATHIGENYKQGDTIIVRQATPRPDFLPIEGKKIQTVQWEVWELGTEEGEAVGGENTEDFPY